MKELVLFIARELAHQPDRVQVAETDDGHTIHLKLTSADEDKGRLIGKQGKVIKAVRALASAAASLQRKKAVVQVE
jgi:hypothetical protein